MRRMLWCLACTVFLTAAGKTMKADDVKSVPPPQGAIVLFDGKDLSGWTNAKGQPVKWKVHDGYMECAPGTGSIMTKAEYGPDVQLHVEFWLPLMADKKGQGRSNSGVYVLGRYEIQVLDSYENDTYFAGGCGSLYGIIEAKKGASKPPEQWQSFDITFRAPLVDDAGKVSRKGRVTVVHNGIKVIDDGEFDKVTFGGLDTKMVSRGPLWLQDHGNHVRFRNIWYKPLD